MNDHPEAFLYVPSHLNSSASTPKAVRIVHRQDGIGTGLEHRVEIKDAAGLILAEFPLAWAARWLAERGYRWVPGSNGAWLKS